MGTVTVRIILVLLCCALPCEAAQFQPLELHLRPVGNGPPRKSSPQSPTAEDLLRCCRPDPGDFRQFGPSVPSSYRSRHPRAPQGHKHD